MESVEETLADIHRMLVRICKYIDKIEDPEYQRKKDEKSFTINVLADLFVDKLNECKEQTENK